MALFDLPDGPASSIGSSKRTPSAGRFHLIGGILDAPALLGAALGFLLIVVCFPDAARFLGDKIPVQSLGLVHSGACFYRRMKMCLLHDGFFLLPSCGRLFQYVVKLLFCLSGYPSGSTVHSQLFRFFREVISSYFILSGFFDKNGKGDHNLKGTVF